MNHADLRDCASDCPTALPSLPQLAGVDLPTGLLTRLGELPQAEAVVQVGRALDPSFRDLEPSALSRLRARIGTDLEGFLKPRPKFEQLWPSMGTLLGQ